LDAPTSIEQEIVFTRCPALPNSATLASQLGYVGNARDNGASVTEFIGADKFAQDARYWLRYAGYSKPLWAFGNGEDTRLVGLSKHRSACAVYTLQRGDMASGADLKGRRIALFRDAGLKLDYNRIIYLQTLDAALKDAGLALSDVALVDFAIDREDFMRRAGVDYARLNDTPEGYSAPVNLFTEIARTSVELLLAGRVDAIAANLPAGVAEFLGLRKIYDPAREKDVHAAHDLRCLIVSGALARERRADLVGLIADLLAAGDWARANGADETSRLLARDLRVDRDVLMLDTDDIVGGMSIGLSPEDLAMLEHKKRFLLAQGLIDRDIDLSAWADPTIMDEARALARERAAG